MGWIDDLTKLKCCKCGETLVGKLAPGLTTTDANVGPAMKYEGLSGKVCYRYHGQNNYYCQDCYQQNQQREEERRRRRREEEEEEKRRALEEQKRKDREERKRRVEEERERCHREERRRQREEEKERERQQQEQKMRRRQREQKQRERQHEEQEKRAQSARIVRQIKENEYDFNKVIHKISKERIESQATEMRRSAFKGPNIHQHSSKAFVSKFTNQRTKLNKLENTLISFWKTPEKFGLDWEETDFFWYDVGDLLEDWHNGDTLNASEGDDLYNWILRYLAVVYFTQISELGSDLVIEQSCQALEEVLATCSKVSEKVELVYNLYDFIENSDTHMADSFLSSFLSALLSHEGIIEGSAENPPEWAMAALNMLLKISFQHLGKECQGSVRPILDIVYHGTWTFKEVVDILSTVVELTKANWLLSANMFEQIKAKTFTERTYLNIVKNLPDIPYHFQELLKRCIIEAGGEKDIWMLCDELKSRHMFSDDSIDRAQMVTERITSNLYRCGYPDGFISEMPCSQTLIRQMKKTSNNNPTHNNFLLSEMLTHICCAVRKTQRGYWPRSTQILSSVLLLQSEKSMGRILEIATGEGKSCIIAMVAGALALVGRPVDIVTSSPVLAKRDADDWSEFYKFLQLNVSHNIDLKTEKNKRACYKSNIIYGTVSSFAADILEHEFQMKNVRPERKTSESAVIVDEVDFMMLDQGVQFTYLNHETLGFRHLDPTISLIWASVQRFTPFTYNDSLWFYDRFQPFYKTIHDTLQGVTDKVNVEDIIEIAENYEILEQGLIGKIEKEQNMTKRQSLLAKIDSEMLLKIFHLANAQLDVGFEVFKSTKDGFNKVIDPPNANFSILLLENGYCSTIIKDDKTLGLGVADLVLESINGVDKRRKSEVAGAQSDDNMNTSKIQLPKFLLPYMEDRLLSWVENAFLALQMTKDKDYLVVGKEVIPVDKSTGILEHNKKWGDGLQQFLELKHALPLSQISLVTNFMSNLIFFKRYGPRLYGVTGTLGSDTDKKFLRNEFDIDLCALPTHKFNRRCENRERIEANETEWLLAIQEELELETYQNKYRKQGRAALIICEDIKTADTVSRHIKSAIKGKLYMYTGSCAETSTLPNLVNEGDVIIATNLAGRGTDISVSQEVNDAGGLFVLLTYLPSNIRIEKQVFGRTGRKGQPGSAKLVLNHETIHASYLQNGESISELREARDIVEKSRMHSLIGTDLKECREKEDLFIHYCSKLRDAMTMFSSFEEDEKELAINTLHEKWGMWLQMRSDKVDLNEVIRRTALDILQKKYENPYQMIVQGNSFFKKKNYQMAKIYYERAIRCDGNWSCIAFYNHAHCRLLRKGDDYMSKAKDDLENALIMLKNYRCEFQQVNANAMVSMRASGEKNTDEYLLWKDLDSRNQVISSFERNISESLAWLTDLQTKKKDAKVVSKYMFHLLDKDNDTQRDELVRLYKQGLIQLYSIEEEPGFCWSGLAVLCLGLIQVATGILLTAVSAGFLATIGSSLIAEGIADVFAGIKGIYYGEFDWKAWGVEKALSLSITVCTMGISSIMSRGVKASCSGLRTTIKETWRQGAQIGKVLKLQWGTQALKGCFTGACKVACKEFVKQSALQIANYAEDKVFQEVMNNMEDHIHTAIRTSVMKSAHSGKLSKSIVAAVTHTVTKYAGVEHMNDLQIADWQQNIEEHFLVLGQEIIHNYTNDPQWMGFVRQFANGILGGLKHRHRANQYINFIEKAVKITAISKGAIDAKKSTIELLTYFDEKMHQRIQVLYKIDEVDTQAVEREMRSVLDGLKTVIGEKMAKILGQAIRSIWQQKCVNLLTSEIKSSLNRKLTEGMDRHLGMEKTRQKISDEVTVLHAASMTLDVIETQSNITDKICQEVDSLKNHDDEGNVFHLRMMADKLGQTIVVKDTDGNIKIRVGNQLDTASITLVHSEEGHYDAEVNGHKVCIDNIGKDCIFQAVAAASGVEKHCLKYASKNLKDMCASELELNPGKWVHVYERIDQVQSMRRQLLLAGGARRRTRRPVGRVDKGQVVIGQAITKRDGVELDHWPPFDSIEKAIALAQGDSVLAKHFQKMAGRSDGNINRDKLPCLVRDKGEHRQCLTTGNSAESRAGREVITAAIVANDCETMLKATFIMSDAEFAYNYRTTSIRYEKRSDMEYKTDCHNVLKFYRDKLPESVMSLQTYQNLSQWVDDGGARDRTDLMYRHISNHIDNYCEGKRSHATRRS